MKKCLVRERIDVDGEWKVSYMHKVWDDGTVEFYTIAVTPHPTVDHNAKITEAQWLDLAKTHPPQATYPNSDWGCGLPGAGDQWAKIPAAERGVEG